MHDFSDSLISVRSEDSTPLYPAAHSTAPRTVAAAPLLDLRVLLFPLLVLTTAAILRMQGTVDPDVSWQLWIADRIDHGARLYRDIIEINPPLWFWMALPIDRLAALTGVRSDVLMIGAIATGTAAAVVGTARLTTHMSARGQAILLTYAALALFAVPWVHVGQREQIALIAAVPYAALIAARHGGRRVSPGLGFAVGAGAAVGFALKHYFLLVPGFLELWLYVCQRRSWRIVRPETLALSISGAAYACAALLFAPDFFTTTLPLIHLAYGATGAPHFTDLFQTPIWIALLMAGLVASQRHLKLRDRAPLTSSLLVAAAGFAAAYFMQAKGWMYHAIPLVGCVSLALASLVAEIQLPPRTVRLFAVALLVPLGASARETRAQTLPTPELERAVSGLPRGATVGFLATEPAIAWSVTYQHHLRFASRYYGFWMIRAIIQNEHALQPNPRLAQLRRDIVHQTVVDFECLQAQRVIVSRPPPRAIRPTDFDILPYFMQDPEFAVMFTHYRSIGRGDTLDVYELAAPLDRPPPSSCRRGV